MTLDLEEIKKLHDKAYTHSQGTRERATNDMVFYYITQWDDSILSETQLAYRGEFNILRKAGRSILSDLASNPVQVDFEPLDDTREDAADIIDGLYRTDDNKNISIEAQKVGSTESVVCGVGAWELCTRYKSMRSGSDKQIIERKPIHEANNVVFWDPNAKLLDKSDAKYCSVLECFSEDGYKELVEDLTGEEDADLESFKTPEQSYVFPWVMSGGKKIYVVKFYYREKIKDKILTMTDAFQQTIQVYEKQLADVMDELLASGYEIVAEKEIERWRITRYIASDKEILKKEVIAGEHIPIIPVYGERAIIDGEEHYEGIVKLAKDPQRLRNFQMSYLADIVSRSPRGKNIYYPEQVAGFEQMYSETGSENNFPYLLQNRKAPDGTDLPLGAIGQTPNPDIPNALVQSIALSREAVSDVANAGVTQDVADVDLSGKAVLALQARLDMQSQIYQDNLKHAKRRDGEVYASMASEIYDVPRTAKLTMPDGARKDVTIMQSVIDAETGNIVIINDISNAEFEVSSQIGPSYKSQKDQTIDRLSSIVESLQVGDPMREILVLKLLKLMDGVDFDDVREYARKQLIIKGIQEPETEEEAAMLEAANSQADEPSAEMVLSQAEMLKGQAALAKEQREYTKMGIEAKLKEMGIQVDTFNAQTKRLDTQIDAQEAGANIDFKRVDTFGKKLDNTQKIIQLQDFKNMTDEELFQRAAG